MAIDRDASSAPAQEPGRLPDKAAAYDAFISYSYRDDDDLASALQAGLQRFAKPWYRLRALLVFRDRADLSARPELWSSVEKALASSRWFILLASAGTTTSSWVNREVLWWLEHRTPERFIIVATSPGLAWNAQLGDWAAEAPVPPALRGALAQEPLWASLVHLPREGMRRLPDEVIADVAAPIWDKPKGQLVGVHLREHRRTMRLVRGAVSALVLLTATAVVAAWLAIVAAENATHQRNLTASGELAAESLGFDTTNPVTAAQLAAAAWRIAPTIQADESLLQAYAQPERGIFTTSGPLMADGPQSVAFSPDGKILATTTNLGMRLWNLATDREIGTPITITGGDCAVAFSPNGKLVATATDDGTVQFWNAATSHSVGRQINVGSDQQGVGCGLAFRPGGKMLATGGPDGSLRLWSLRTYKPIGTAMAVGGGGVEQVAFNPTGTILAAADRNSTITMWNPATHARIGPAMTDPGGLGTVAFSPSGRMLASTGGDDVRFWSAINHREIGDPLVISHNGANAVAFSPTEPVVATADADGTAKLWDLATHRQVGPVMAAGNNGAYGSVAFSPNGKWLATASDIGITRLWSLALYEPVGSPLTAGGHAAVTGVAFNPGGKILATVAANGTVRLEDASTRRQIGPPITAPSQNGLTGVAISPDGALLAIAGGGHVWLRSMETRRLISPPLPGVNAANAQGLGPNVLAFSANGATLAFVSTVHGQTAIRLWDVAARRQIGQPIGYLGVAAVAFSPHGKIIASGGYGQTASLWNVKTRRRIGVSMPVGSGFRFAQAMAFSPDGNTLAIAAGDQVQLWNVATQRPDGNIIIAGDGGNAAVAFSPNGELLATADADGTVRLWDVATQQQIGPAMTPSAAGGVNAVAFSPNGQLLATADGDGTVQLLDVAFPRDLAHAVCAIAGRYLAPREWSIYARGEPYQKVC